MTITNANFDADAIENQIKKMISVRDRLKEKAEADDFHDAATIPGGFKGRNAGKSRYRRCACYRK